VNRFLKANLNMNSHLSSMKRWERLLFLHLFPRTENLCTFKLQRVHLLCAHVPVTKINCSLFHSNRIDLSCVALPELRSPGSLASRSCLFGQNILASPRAVHSVIGLCGSLQCSVFLCLFGLQFIDACEKRKVSGEIVGDGCRVRHLQG